MLSTLRELGILSARYAEEEGIVSKQSTASEPVKVPVPVSIPVTVAVQDSGNKAISTIVSTPVPVASTAAATVPVTQNVPGKVLSPALSSVSSASLPSSPIISHSPSSSNGDCSVPAVVPVLAQRASLPPAAAANNFQPFGLNFVPVNSTYNSGISTPQGILVQTPMGLTHLSAVPATMLATAPRYVAAPPVEPVSSLASSRLRKPFHKRRPAHMDKSMLVCHCCGRKETPEWRKGPDGPATLCNACGLQWAKKVRSQRNSSPSSVSATTTSKPSTPKPTDTAKST